MNKTIHKTIVSTILMALLIVFTSCVPQVFSTYIGGTEEAETEAATNIETELVEEYSAANDLVINAESAALNADADQTITIPFQNGLIDEDTISSGIKVYPLSDTDGTDPDAAYERGDALSYTYEFVRTGETAWNLVLTLDLSGTNISNRLELFIDPTVLTANSGTLTIDTDSDGVSAEDNEDDDIRYLNVTGAPVTLTSGEMRGPQDSIAVNTNATIAAGDTAFTLAAANSVGNFTNMTTDSLTSSWVWEKFVDGSWQSLSVTESYDDTTGDITCTLAADAATGDIYRLTLDRYTTMESEAVAGYVHKLTTDQNPSNRYAYQTYIVGTPFDLNADPVTGSVSNRLYTLTFPGDTLDETTINTDTIEMYRHGDILTQWESISVIDNEVLLFMPEEYAGHEYTAHIYPGIQDEGPDLTVDTDNYYYYDSSDESGVHELELYVPVQIKVTVFTSNSPEEISWEILNEDDQVVADGGPYTIDWRDETSNHTLRKGNSYTVVLYDSAGDGWDNANITIENTSASEIVVDEFSFSDGSQASTSFSF